MAFWSPQRLIFALFVLCREISRSKRYHSPRSCGHISGHWMAVCLLRSTVSQYDRPTLRMLTTTLFRSSDPVPIRKLSIRGSMRSSFLLRLRCLAQVPSWSTGCTEPFGSLSTTEGGCPRTWKPIVRSCWMTSAGLGRVRGQN